MKQNIKKILRTNTLLTKISCSLMIAISAFHNVGHALPLNNANESALLNRGLFFNKTSENTESSNSIASLRLGVYSDYVFNRKLTSYFPTNTTLEIKGKTFNSSSVNKTTIQTNAASLALNLFDLVDVFGTFGYKTIDITGPCSIFSYASNNSLPFMINYNPEVYRADYSSETSSICTNNAPIFNNSLSVKNTPFFGAGIQATIFKFNNFNVGINAKYTGCSTNKFTANNSIFNIHYPIVTKTKPDLIAFETSVRPDKILKSTLNYQEWSAGGSISYKIQAFSPYIGIQYSITNFYSNGPVVQSSGTFKYNDFNNDQITFFGSINLKNQKTYNAVLGFNLAMFETLMLGAEGRYGEETAVTVSAKVRF